MGAPKAEKTERIKHKRKKLQKAFLPSGNPCGKMARIWGHDRLNSQRHSLAEFNREVKQHGGDTSKTATN